MYEVAIGTAAAFAAGGAGWVAAAARFQRQVRRLRNRVRTAEVQARHDRLTGLANRYGMEQAHRGLSAGALVVAVVDLDGFKPVNDTLGHEAGDLVLCEAASRIRAYCGGVDERAVAVRLGGDEFAALVPVELDAVDEDAVTRVVQRHAAALYRRLTADRAWVPGCAEFVLRASVGATVAPVGGGLEDALSAADTAMYVAKQAGGGTATRPFVAEASGDRAGTRSRDLAHGRPLAAVSGQVTTDIEEAA
ncbi:MAG TPA: GGDEF domain-containing protein [Actinocatenispora sp.]